MDFQQLIFIVARSNLDKQKDAVEEWIVNFCMAAFVRP